MGYIAYHYCKCIGTYGRLTVVATANSPDFCVKNVIKTSLDQSMASLTAGMDHKAHVIDKRAMVFKHLASLNVQGYRLTALYTDDNGADGFVVTVGSLDD